MVAFENIAAAATIDARAISKPVFSYIELEKFLQRPYYYDLERPFFQRDDRFFVSASYRDWKKPTPLSLGNFLTLWWRNYQRTDVYYHYQLCNCWGIRVSYKRKKCYFISIDLKCPGGSCFVIVFFGITFGTQPRRRWRVVQGKRRRASSTCLPVVYWLLTRERKKKKIKDNWVVGTNQMTSGVILTC